jgi:hypothetical protein
MKSDLFDWCLYTFIAIATGVLVAHNYFTFYRRVQGETDDEVDEDLVVENFKMMFAFADPGQVDPGLEGVSSKPMRYIKYFFIWTYLLVAAVVMTNLLIAMMASTYAKVLNAADEEFAMIRGNLIKEFHFARSIGPPFSLLEILGRIVMKFSTSVWNWLRLRCVCCCPRRCGRERSSGGERNHGDTAHDAHPRSTQADLDSPRSPVARGGHQWPPQESTSSPRQSQRKLRAQQLATKHDTKPAWFKETRHADRLQVSYGLSQALKQVTSAPMWEQRTFDRILSSTERKTGILGGSGGENWQRGTDEQHRHVSGEGMMGAEGNTTATLVMKIDKLQEDAVAQAAIVEKQNQRHQQTTDELLQKIRDMQTKQGDDLHKIMCALHVKPNYSHHEGHDGHHEDHHQGHHQDHRQGHHAGHVHHERKHEGALRRRSTREKSPSAAPQPLVYSTSPAPPVARNGTATHT